MEKKKYDLEYIPRTGSLSSILRCWEATETRVAKPIGQIDASLKLAVIRCLLEASCDQMPLRRAGIIRALCTLLSCSSNHHQPAVKRDEEGVATTNPFPSSSTSPYRREEVCPSLERQLARHENAEPAIILKNHSSFQVSYWVIQEDKLKTTAITETISRKMGASLAVSGGSVTGTLGASKARDTETIQEQCQDGYVRMADYRVGREGTTMPFPKNCDDLRVLGFFRRDSSQAWECYKDKVYSISRGEKIITLVATDERIKRHQ